jgi:hypothetical protein
MSVELWHNILAGLGLPYLAKKKHGMLHRTPQPRRKNWLLNRLPEKVIFPSF